MLTVLTMLTPKTLCKFACAHGEKRSREENCLFTCPCVQRWCSAQLEAPSSQVNHQLMLFVRQCPSRAERPLYLVILLGTLCRSGLKLRVVAFCMMAFPFTVNGFGGQHRELFYNSGMKNRCRTEDKKSAPSSIRAPYE